MGDVYRRNIWDTRLNICGNVIKVINGRTHCGESVGVIGARYAIQEFMHLNRVINVIDLYYVERIMSMEGFSFK